MRTAITVRRILIITVQILLLWGLSALCQLVATAWHAPVPGSMIAFALLFLLLQARLVPLSWVEQGANFLLAQLLLFFVPSAVGVIQYPHIVHTEGLQLYLIIAVSTATVMTVTGLSAESILQKRKRFDDPRTQEGTL